MGTLAILGISFPVLPIFFKLSYHVGCIGILLNRFSFLSVGSTGYLSPKPGSYTGLPAFDGYPFAWWAKEPTTGFVIIEEPASIQVIVYAVCVLLYLFYGWLFHFSVL